MQALEAKAANAVRFLTRIHESLAQFESPEAIKWLDETAKLRAHSSKTSTIIGVIGATGAGKSALINALLDEERILPTNCMRACTAVVTEISYNDSDIPYRAEVEFLSEDDWRFELKMMFGDLLDDQGNLMPNINNEGHEAGIAYSKMKSVYPGISRDGLANASIDELMSHESMTHLGTTKTIEDKQADSFYEKLQVYIDSKEKVDLRLKSTKLASGVLEFWPLIKVVRIFVKSRVLKSGAILVDLPGVHDSNAARAEVARTYLKKCLGLFIVAPITRAVDDKSAKTLLGQAFKQQLKLDGTFGNVTFICSQTDNISTSEAAVNLGLSEQIAPLQQEIDDIAELTNRLETAIESLEKSLDMAEEVIENADLDLEMYQAQLLHAHAGAGFRAASSFAVSRKRKRTNMLRSCRKRATPQNILVIDSDEEQQEDSEDERIEEASNEPAHLEHDLTKPEIEEKVLELREKKTSARNERDRLLQLIKTKDKGPRANKKRRNVLRTQIAKLCILGRNEYSRAAIKQDFAEGIRELDQELAAESDPENFDPSEDVRDYDQVAQSLPVFCVSSRGYQKLSGNLKKEVKPWGFERTSETEVPQLQDHCLQVAEALQADEIRFFLDKVALLCNSLRIWISNQEQRNSLTEDELSHMEVALKIELQNFTQNLLDFSESIIAAVQSDIRVHVLGTFPKGIAKASSQATVTVEHWGRPVDRSDPAASGLHALTYRATTRRNGYFPKKCQTIDFNRELADPLVNHVIHGWERVFNRLAPAIFRDALQNSATIFVKFKATINGTATKHRIRASSLLLLERQVDAHASAFKDALKVARLALITQQKEINRQFVPAVTGVMANIYSDCANERGSGMFVRMKRIMEKAIQEGGDTMFRACVETIEDNLKQMMKTVRQELLTKTQDIATWIEQDYLQLSSKRSHELLLQEKLLKDTILTHVNGYEPASDQMLTGPIEATEDAQQMDFLDMPGLLNTFKEDSAQPKLIESQNSLPSQEEPVKASDVDDEPAEDIPDRKNQPGEAGM